MTHEVLLTAYAEADLMEIGDWISHHDGVLKAQHVIDRIESAIIGLSRFPHRGNYTDELLVLGIREFREVFFKPYRIIYRIEGRKVVVEMIADGRRDMQTLLAKRLLGA